MSLDTSRGVGRVATILTALVLPIVAIAQPAKVVAYGDSVTRGFPFEPNDPRTYPSQLADRLDSQFGPDAATVVNRGINGLRADELLADVQGSLLDLDNPDIALVMIGGNDFLQAAPTITEAADVQAVIDQTVTETLAIVNTILSHTNPDGSTPEVILAGITPNRVTINLPDLSTTGSRVAEQYNTLLEAALPTGVRYFDDNFYDLFDPISENAIPSLMTDPIHPNAAGLELIAENFAPRVAEIIIPEPASAMLLLALLLRRSRH